MRMALIQVRVWKTPTKQYPSSAGVLMEGFWRVKSTRGEGRLDTFSAEGLRGSSARRETSFVIVQGAYKRQSGRVYKYRRCRTLGSLIVQLRNRSSSSLSARVKDRKSTRLN